MFSAEGCRGDDRRRKRKRQDKDSANKTQSFSRGWVRGALQRRHTIQETMDVFRRAKGPWVVRTGDRHSLGVAEGTVPWVDMTRAGGRTSRKGHHGAK